MLHSLLQRHEDIPQVKMLNPNLYKNKSYEMNWIWAICLYNVYKKYKVHVIGMTCFFYKLGLNIFPWGISSCLFNFWVTIVTLSPDKVSFVNALNMEYRDCWGYYCCVLMKQNLSMTHSDRLFVIIFYFLLFLLLMCRGKTCKKILNSR